MEYTFSMFANFRQTRPSDTTMAGVYRLITADPVLRGRTVSCRACLEAGEKEKAAAEKSSCPAFTPAVRCEGGRQRKHIVAYTGLSLCDFDHVAPEKMGNAFAAVAADPHTLLAYRTVSGAGFRVIFAFEGVAVAGADPRARATLAAYQEAYRQGNAYYARLCGLEYDPLCKNPERIT